MRLPSILIIAKRLHIKAGRSRFAHPRKKKTTLISPTLKGLNIAVVPGPSITHFPKHQPVITTDHH